jgi:hypothetical protein
LFTESKEAQPAFGVSKYIILQAEDNKTTNGACSNSHKGQ